MLYIHQAYCISPQKTFQDVDLEIINEPVEKRLLATEPTYEGIPPGILRRMGRAVRMGVGASMPVINSAVAINGKTNRIIPPMFTVAMLLKMP